MLSESQAKHSFFTCKQVRDQGDQAAPGRRMQNQSNHNGRRSIFGFLHNWHFRISSPCCSNSFPTLMAGLLLRKSHQTSSKESITRKFIIGIDSESWVSKEVTFEPNFNDSHRWPHISSYTCFRGCPKQRPYKKERPKRDIRTYPGVSIRNERPEWLRNLRLSLERAEVRKWKRTLLLAKIKGIRGLQEQHEGQHGISLPVAHAKIFPVDDSDQIMQPTIGMANTSLLPTTISLHQPWVRRMICRFECPRHLASYSAISPKPTGLGEAL